MNDEGHWRYWYIGSPHMKDICDSLTSLSKKYGEDFEIVSVEHIHKPSLDKCIVLYRYWTTGDGEDDIYI